eukprot:jgi/Ulvmu1/12902/UM098_0090.1
MSRQIARDNKFPLVEQMGADDVAAADALWIRTVDDAINGQHQTISALHEHISEMDATLRELATLHDSIKYDIMVPYGRVAMFPGKMVHTNEVFVHLSSDIAVHTSTKHAQAVLQRRRDYTVEKQELVQQQLDSLKSRRVFAESEKVQDGEAVQEIVEVYDEELHGPEDAPTVSNQVHASRQYHGPPRNESERSAEAAAMHAMRSFVAEHALSMSSAASVPQHTRVQVDAPKEPSGPCQADSDDADSSDLAPQPVLAPADPCGAQVDNLIQTRQLEQEMDRLVAAFEAAGSNDDSSETAMGTHATSGPRPLIQEIQNSSLQQQSSSWKVSDDANKAGQVPNVPVTNESRAATTTGLRHGFLNKGARPKKSILKKTAVRVSAPVAGKPSGPHLSQALVDKQAPTAAEASAFSGVVKERPARPAGNEVVREIRQANTVHGPPQSTKRISKFKSQRAAANGSTESL